jgi:3-deoxy-D-manno-octulosonate 8-phosphate phosphatase (KDO 8-P phosphatase)
MSMSDPDWFNSIGGVFAFDYEAFKAKVSSINALVFDWDGVFNRGQKTGSGHSGFSEADSMGINLLRFGLWLRDGSLPFAAIISGAENEMAAYFAGREHFHAIATGVKRKDLALLKMQNQFGLHLPNTAFFFDDVIDFSAANLAGLRIFFPHPAAPLTKSYVASHHLFDYMPGNRGGELGIREVCELMLSAMELFEPVVRYRMEFSGKYAAYLKARIDVTPVALCLE